MKWDLLAMPVVEKLRPAWMVAEAGDGDEPEIDEGHDIGLLRRRPNLS